MYAGIKHSHMLFITVSLLLFIVRYFLIRYNKPINKPLKIIPHINDTLLLITGISLAFQASINPMEHSWLMAKIIALVLYVWFGMMALNLKHSPTKRLINFNLAIVSFLFIALTAIKKQPFLFGL